MLATGRYLTNDRAVVIVAVTRVAGIHRGSSQKSQNLRVMEGSKGDYKACNVGECGTTLCGVFRERFAVNRRKLKVRSSSRLA